jgi:hypothetical protein
VTTTYYDHLDAMIPAVRVEHERHIAGMTPEERGRFLDHVGSLDDDGLERFMAGQHSMALRRLDQQAIDLDQRMGGGYLDGDDDSPPPRPQRPAPIGGDTTVAARLAGGAAPEATGLTSAIAYATQMSSWFLGNATSTEQWIASLQGQGGVTGPAITAAHQAVEKQHETAAAWAACAVVLGGQTQVREAYQANPGAGNREFVTND